MQPLGQISLMEDALASREKAQSASAYQLEKGGIVQAREEGSPTQDPDQFLLQRCGLACVALFRLSTPRIGLKTRRAPP